MKTAKKVVLRSSALAVAAIGVMGATAPAFADFTATVAGSNIYLWRGQAISGPSPQISGSLDFADKSGVFAGVWTSSEGGFDNSSETDFYGGYKGKAANFSYAFTLWQYYYPSMAESSDTSSGEDGGSYNSPAEWQVSLGYDLASAGAVSAGVLVDMNDSGNQYYTLGYTFDKVSATFGFWERNEADDFEQSEYAHLDLMYQATPELKFGVSMITEAAEADDGEYLGGLIYQKSGQSEEHLDPADDSSPLLGGNQDKDPLFYVSYAKTFEL